MWSNPFASCPKKVIRLVVTVVEITSDVLKFDGRSRLDALSIDLGRGAPVAAGS